MLRKKKLVHIRDQLYVLNTHRVIVCFWGHGSVIVVMFLSMKMSTGTDITYMHSQ